MTRAKHIQTQRLTLRPLRRRDVWFFSKLIGDPQVRRFLGGPVPLRQRPKRFRQYLNAPPNVGIWVACLTSTGHPIGLVETGPHKNGTDIEVSYQFRPAFWGQGLAREALLPVLAHALDGAGTDRIIAETQSANAASCRLLEALGMVEVERLERFGAEQVIFATQPKPPFPQP